LRRFLHGLLVGGLTLWIPIDSAVAGWWHHHHRHAPPMVWGPAFPPPCGAGIPFPGWAGAIVIDDRPLAAPSPFAVQFVAPTEVIVGPWVATAPVEGAAVDEGIILHGETVTEGASIGDADCVCDPCQEGTEAHGEVVFEGRVTGTPESIVVEGYPLGDVIDGESVLDVPTQAEPPATVVTGNRPVDPAPRTETAAEPETPSSLELPGSAATTTSAEPSTATLPNPTEAPAASVLEPWEPKTVQGDATAADMPTDEPATAVDEPGADDAESFERPDAPADVDSTDEPMADEADAAPAQPKRRNLFDDAPADETEAFEGPRKTDGDPLPPGDAFDAPDDAFEAPKEAMESVEGDDAFGIPEEPPMDDAPADAKEQDAFEPATDDVMDETPADEPAIEEPASDAPAVEEPATEEAPADADPFDTSVLHTPGQPSRSWRDDTGRHGTEGRLVEVHADRVRILKATGRYTTVPMSRLSPADRDHVAGVALALGRPAAQPGETAGL
jgi:hypothetical protein